MRTHAWLLFMVFCLALSCSCKSSQENPAQQPVTIEKQPDTLTVAVVGDIMMGNTFPHDRLPAEDGKHIFDDVRDILKGATVTCGNLEGTIATSGKPRKNLNSPMAFMFMMPPRYTQHLLDAGFDFVGLANNHIYDFFDEAMTQTEENLEKAGIGYAGARDPKGQHAHQEFCTKLFITPNGDSLLVGFSAFGHEDYSLRTRDTATVRRIVKTLKDEKGCDLVILSFHGGKEGSGARHLPYGSENFYGDERGFLRDFAHFAIDCGADIIYGHGPHVVRAVELYKDRFIAYSLGNFCTAGMGVQGLTGYAPLVTIRIDKAGKFIDGKIHSFLQQTMKGPKTDPKNLVAKEIATLTKEDIKDSRLSIAEDGTIKRNNSGN
ncbi:MAG: CapA family protein [Bacteroidales bacterium]|nr:CapA family protein [Bacteroidales bacterium]